MARYTRERLGDPFRAQSIPLLVAGIKRAQARAHTLPKPRLPITPTILTQLQTRWIKNPPSHDGLMLWAAACPGFFGFLRAGEFTVPSAGAYDREVHLSLNDLATDCHSNPSLFRVRIKQSKTDPFRQGVCVSRYHEDSNLPSARSVGLSREAWPSPGPLFLFHSGTPLTRAALVDRLHLALQQSGLEPTTYNGHKMWHRRFDDTDARPLEELGLPSRHLDPAPATSHSVCPTTYCASSANSRTTRLHRLTFSLPSCHYIHCITWCHHIGGIITLTFN